ncbi:Semaphorin-7A Semaphorin-K1 [Triplophysa tibetana]|uniref:Semaphorin-7A Semaphorin-K1 n=1 Tax=Triplophysa tibetana TaxID=1572043 RepID=A0A5A9PUP7_9TELE|nr:Semaphorin-7A Semaphorin-K1 [Triplophysa tibetana]
MLLKRRLTSRWFICGLWFQLVFSEDASKPRLTLQQDDALLYNRNYNHTVLFHEKGSNILLVGGLNFVLQVDFENGENETFILNPKLQPFCEDKSCENVVTVIEQFQNSTLVCGTNGENPMCWTLFYQKNKSSTEVKEYGDGTGISPHMCTQNSLCLTAEPTFISSFLAERNDDPPNEKIYILFREKNTDTSPDADPWISRVARVCKVDEGGPKEYLQNIWTSFLKARLVCGIAGESLYFNRLQDIFVVHAENWTDSRVYALFSSSWNSTAVCIYSLKDLDAIFENSAFKDYDGKIPSKRPGTCVKNSNSIPISTLNIIKYYPEMQGWIRPIHKDTPFFMSKTNYTKIAVDKVEASDGLVYNVLLLAKDNGMILKVLEIDTKAFIISETRLNNGSSPVQAMKLDSETNKLFVGYPDRISVLDLKRCQDYNASCEFCVLSRDPYCAWTENGCTAQTKGGIQNIADGNTYVCDRKKGMSFLTCYSTIDYLVLYREKSECVFNECFVERRSKRDSRPSSVPSVRHSLPAEIPFYLSCTVDSQHATYRWKHGNKSTTCQLTQSECLLLIPSMTSDDYGNYKCISHERDYTRIVKEYYLNPEHVADSASNLKCTMATLVTVVIYLF